MSSHRIKVLSKDIVNKISAGEVVERPASVVKELVENSLDAGSGSISIEIQKAGKQSIRVSDDGSGMSSEDTELSCRRHSTSKISSSYDLENIKTLGFRGEALASISSVSNMCITSCVDSEQGATEICLEGGQVVDKKIVGREKGTTVEVRNLFFNTPARRKFFKTDATEFSHIVNVVGHFILAAPDIEFKLIHGNKNIFHVTKDMDLKDRIGCVLGEDLANNLIKIYFNDALFKLCGYISKPGYTRKKRKNQIFFVNKRYVQNATLSHALYQGYFSLVERGRYPVAVVFIKIKPDQVDVNVHPAKLEIKFLNQSIVHDKFKYAVNQTIQNFKLESGREIGFDKNVKFPKSNKNKSGFAKPNGKNIEFDFERKKGIFEKLSYDKYIKADGNRYYQLNNTYIVDVLPDKIKITDQHAAHERILYELFSKAIEERKIQKQNLLLPERIDLSKEDIILLEQQLKLFKTIGFEIEDFGQRSFNIQAIPAILKERNTRNIFRDILDDIKELGKNKANVTEEIIKIAACRSAIKAGDKLSEQEIESLLRNLKNCKLPFTCPHVRPVQIEINIKELEKRFRRK